MEYNTMSMFGPAGLLEESLENYEYRQEQADMAEMVYQSLNEKRHGVIEAGCGVGKSLAYLIPAIFFAVKHKKRVVIATHTLNLQDQLFGKDIPLLAKSLPFAFRAELFKGRSNYLCLRRLQECLFHEGQEVHAHYVRIDEWLKNSGTGVISDYPNKLPTSVWRDIHCQKESCPEEDCSFFKKCFYWQLRHGLNKAQVIVTNQAMLLADAVTEGAVLPKYHAVVIDEAHNLEEVATQAFTKELSRQALLGYYATGILLHKVVKAQLPLHASDLLRSLLEGLLTEGHDFFNQLRQTRLEQTLVRTKKDKFDQNIICHYLKQILAEISEWELTDQEQQGLVTKFSDYTRELIDRVTIILAASDRNYVFWLERKASEVSMLAAPIKTDQLLQENLFAKVPSAILTSATLSTDSNFDYLKKRVGLTNPQELLLGSPFNYAKQAVLCVPNQAPHPKHPRYTWYLSYLLLHTIAATKGQVLALFTSYHTMQEVADLIDPKLAKEGYSLFVQGDEPRMQLVEKFRHADKSVLLGTNSFWEGLDIPGDSLQAVVITRLPFAVPDHPVVAARLREVERNGGNSFQDYSVPQAILRLKQGFGRLIRSHQDRGGVVILDERILTASYGKQFLSSLPPATFTRDFTDLRRILN